MEIPKNVISYVRENIGANYAVSFVGEKKGVFAIVCLFQIVKQAFQERFCLMEKGAFLNMGAL